MNSISLSIWLYNFFSRQGIVCINTSSDLEPGIDNILSGNMNVDEVEYSSHIFLKKKFPGTSEITRKMAVDKIVHTAKTFQTIPPNHLTVCVKSPKSSPITCTPVDTKGAQFSLASVTSSNKICDEVISPTVSFEKYFTFDFNPEKKIKNLKRVDLIYSSTLYSASKRLQDKVSMISDQETRQELEVYVDLITRQLKKERHLKNKIDMMILREEYIKTLCSQKKEVDISLSNSISEFLL